MKKLIALALSAVTVIAFFAGCSCAGDNTSKSKSTTSETLKVIETTSEGGTVEKDSEGNTVTKNKNGEITSVKDKNGKSVDINEYIKKHPEADSNNSDNKSDSSSKSDNKKDNKKDNKSNSKSSNSSEIVEESIPDVIASVPKDDDEIETIDLDF